MTRIAIVIGSTRRGRRSELVGEWVARLAEKRDDAEFVVLDLAEWDLPMFDEENPPSLGKAPTDPRVQRWAAEIDACDGFVFVTPEYNHSMPGVLKNAIDHLYYQWHHKAAGFVSYGSAGGVRAVEQLRLVLAEVKVATVRSQVFLSLFTDFTISDPAEPGEFHPGEAQEPALEGMLDEVIAWSNALAPVRAA
jgi:NAD(P)H-dependent FMN reductase